MIDVSGLTKSYDDFQALKGVSFKINRGNAYFGMLVDLDVIPR